jgi:hypothetical protein
MINVSKGDGVTVFSNGDSSYALVEIKTETVVEGGFRWVEKRPRPPDFCGNIGCSYCYNKTVKKSIQVEIMYQVYKILPVMDTVLEKNSKTKVINGPEGPLIVKDTAERTYENNGWGERYIRKLLNEEMKQAEGAKQLKEALESAKQNESIVEYLIEEMKASK